MTVASFTSAAESAAAEVRAAADLAAAAAVVADLAGGGEVLVAPAVDAETLEALAGAGVATRVADEDPGSAADAALGLVRASAAVAETGSVLLEEHPVADRLVSMLTRHLVVLVDGDEVVDSLDDVAARLAAREPGAGFASMVTGPSRSADIERSLSIGVQGPERLTVVVVG